jgi:DNA-binding transcriptional ArsR family regulator
MPRQSRRQEILEAIWLREEPSSAQLASMFPRKTLYRHLKDLCEKGLVKKETAPRKEGERGRQSVIYRSNVKFLWSYPTKWLPPPGKKVGGQWFLGVRIKEGIRRRREGDLGRQSHVKLSDSELPGSFQEKTEYEKAKRQQKNPRPAPDHRILEERRQARAEIIRKALEGCASAQTS